MTIDIVMPTAGTKGGVEKVLNAWIKSKISSTHNLRIFHITPGIIDYLNGYPKQWFLPINDQDNFHFDLQYCTEAYTYFISKCGAPDICIATWIPLLTTACYIVKKNLHINMKIVSWIHSEIGVYKESGWGGLEHLEYADFHLCISKNIQTDIQRTYPEAKTFIIGNPINRVKLDNYAPDKHTLCFVGRLSQEKKVDTILKALSISTDKTWKLLIVGDGDKSFELKELCNHLGINKQVSFLGWQLNPWNAAKDASALIISSEYEGFCVSSLEASSIGMTVISTPVGGCVDYIIPGINGYFFNNNDPTNLSIILDYISNDKLSFCDHELCRQSVEPYLTDNYFKRVSSILDTINNYHT